MTIWVHTWWHLLEAQHWIDSPFLAQVTYTCVSISAGEQAACSATPLPGTEWRFTCRELKSTSDWPKRSPRSHHSNWPNRFGCRLALLSRPLPPGLYWHCPPSGGLPKCRRGRRISVRVDGNICQFHQERLRHQLLIVFIRSRAVYPACRLAAPKVLVLHPHGRGEDLHRTPEWPFELGVHSRQWSLFLEPAGPPLEDRLPGREARLRGERMCSMAGRRHFHSVLCPSLASRNLSRVLHG